jgi:hypothetical protein
VNFPLTGLGLITLIQRPALRGRQEFRKKHKAPRRRYIRLLHRRNHAALELVCPCWIQPWRSSSVCTRSWVLRPQRRVRARPHSGPREVRSGSR